MNKFIALVMLLLAAAASFWLEKHGFNDHETGRFQAALWRMQQLDTQFNDDVLKVRFSLINSYDDFADNRRESAQDMETLYAIPGFVQPAARAKIAEGVAQYRALLHTRQGLVERFNSQNAVVVNSSRYLPTVVEELGSGVGGDAAGRELAGTVNALSRAMLANQSGADGGAAEALACTDRLHDWVLRHPRHPKAMLASSLEHHARSVIPGRTHLDALTSGLVELPTAPILAALEDTYQGEIAGALTRAHWYRLSFYFTCAILLATMGYILWAQRGANRQLVRRVRERTAQLARQAGELAVARDTAQAASSAKSAFLASMSHELRTPLNAILGYAQLLRRDRSLGERQHEAVGTMQRSGEHLLLLITDILDLSKIEAGKLELCPARAELGGFLQGVADIIRIRAEEKAVGFRFEPAAGLPRFAEFDEKRLRQVLLNLLGNAVKFTDHGEVVMQVGLLRGSNEQVSLRFEVRDTGVGIAEAELNTIFEPFEQAGDALRRAGGTGLGLSISRELVRLMGGAIGVSSVPGQGSCFWFELTLPVADAAAASARPVRPVTGYFGARRSILVVDDTAANRTVLAETLCEIGFEVRQAADGQESLEQAEAAAPDLVLMDVRMPVMDGLEATRRMRLHPQLKQVPIIAVSAGSDGAGCLAAGANAFIIKPIDHAQLLQDIGELLRLSWLYEALPRQTHGAEAISAPSMVVPPPEDIESLHQLAVAGNMRGIKQCADGLAARDPRFRPFADKLKQLAQAYQSKAILALVESHMAQQQPVES